MKQAIVVVLLAPWLLLGCGGGGGNGDSVLESPVFNITGRFVDGGVGNCVDNFGNPVPGSDSAVLVTQQGNTLTMVIEDSGVRLTGTVSGDAFVVETSLDILGERCTSEFSGTILSNDRFAGVQNIECTDGSSVLCSGTLVRAP